MSTATSTLSRRNFGKFDLLVVGALLIYGTLLLLRMAYLPLYLSSIYCAIFLGVFHIYMRRRHAINIPPLLLLLVYLTVALDGVGNLFGMYNRQFRYIQYDEFTHTASPALVAPVLVWLLREALDRYGYRLPLGLVTFFAVTTMFTIAGFYEIVELWDDKYMHPVPGMRIHGPYDTPNDLQCNLTGMIAGGLIAWLILRRATHRPGLKTEASVPAGSPADRQPR